MTSLTCLKNHSRAPLVHTWSAIVRSTYSYDMFRCKACSAEVLQVKERRSLESRTSDKVRETLEQFFCIRGCTESEAKQHCSVGYVCKKCFLQVDRYNRLQNDVKEVQKALHDKISVAFSAFCLTAQQTSSAIELHSVTLPEVHLVRPTKRAADHSATSQPKRLRLTSSSPGRVTVCLFA